MVLQFDEEDEDADAGPGSDRRRSTPGKARRAGHPVWEVRGSSGKVGEPVRSGARAEGGIRQLGRERVDGREEGRGATMEQRLGKRKVGGGREEAGERAPRRVVATTSSSVKDRLGAGDWRVGVSLVMRCCSVNRSSGGVFSVDVGRLLRRLSRSGRVVVQHMGRVTGPSVEVHQPFAPSSRFSV